MGSLWRAAVRYREYYGYYPERIQADKIYHSRQTLAFCKEYEIRLSGSTLGKPPKDSLLSRQTKKQEYQDNCDYDVAEDIFGASKTTYGLDSIMAYLQETIVSVISVTLLLLNLPRFLRTAFALFCPLSVIIVLPGLRSRI